MKPDMLYFTIRSYKREEAGSINSYLIKIFAGFKKIVVEDVVCKGGRQGTTLQQSGDLQGMFMHNRHERISN
jgi:hypothetical protein